MIFLLLSLIHSKLNTTFFFIKMEKGSSCALRQIKV